MKHNRQWFTRGWQLAVIVSLLACAALSPLLASDVHLHLVPGETAVEYAPAVQSGMGVKKHVAQKRMLPMPVLYLVFLIVACGMTDRSIRMTMRLYPAVSLLRRRIMLLPLKFSSSYVDRLSIPAS